MNGVMTVKKTLTCTLLLASLLGLAACDKKPEDKVEAAKDSAAEAVQNLGDAARQTGEAIEEKTEQLLGHEPTTGEKVEDAAKGAAEAIEDAGEKAREAIDE